MGRFKRRPSAAIVISVMALFMSLGGASYAAFVPNGSVGTAQLSNNAVTNSKIKNNAVTYKKILPGSVGVVRANTGQLQVRVGGTCGANTGFGSIDQAGKVTCNPTLPAEYGATGTATAGSSSTTIASDTLPAGTSYLAFANPNATVTSAGPDQVTISCTLTVGANTQTRTATVHDRRDRDASERLDSAPARGPRRGGERQLPERGRDDDPNGQRDLIAELDSDGQQQLGELPASGRRGASPGSQVACGA